MSFLVKKLREELAFEHRHTCGDFIREEVYKKLEPLHAKLLALVEAVEQLGRIPGGSIDNALNELRVLVEKGTER